MKRIRRNRQMDIARIKQICTTGIIQTPPQADMVSQFSTYYDRSFQMSDLDLIRKYYKTNSAKLEQKILFKKNDKAARRIQR